MLESWAEAGPARFFTNPWLYPPSVLVPKDDLETTALLDLCSLYGTFFEENNDWYIRSFTRWACILFFLILRTFKSELGCWHVSLTHTKIT